MLLACNWADICILPNYCTSGFFCCGFFVGYPIKQFCSACVAYLPWTYITHAFWLLHCEHATTIIYTDRAKSSGTITHPPCLTFKIAVMPLRYTVVKERPGGGNSSLVLVGTCHWEFEIGPIHIPTFPIFQEKVTHSYTNRSNLGQNFDQNYLIFFKI